MRCQRQPRSASASAYAPSEAASHAAPAALVGIFGACWRVAHQTMAPSEIRETTIQTARFIGG